MADDGSGRVRYTTTRLIDDDAVLHRGDFILDADGSWSHSRGDEDVELTLDGGEKVLTRSFQNWHTHLAMVLNRSMGEGLPLARWLDENIFPTEKRLTAELVDIGTQAACAEMIATGTSFAADQYYHPDVVANVLEDCGLRGLACGPITDFPSPSYPAGGSEALSKMDNLLREGFPSERVEYGIGTHAVYTCSEETLLKASELSRQHGCRLHIHTSETRKEVADCHAEHGMYPIEYLDSLDWFTEGTICAHCGWVTKAEMRILAGHGAHAVHCPSSNMKLACGGTLSYPAMVEAGVDVRLGTDGAASNNGLDMRLEAKLASLVQRHDHWDSTILDQRETWRLATKGSIDWAAWDLDDIRMRPRGIGERRILANLIYSTAQCSDLWVAGQALRLDGETLVLDEADIAVNLEDAVADYYDGIDPPQE
jgi:5-methylthioadenosine/S-adenosylhomocysteine deaminase